MSPSPAATVGAPARPAGRQGLVQQPVLACLLLAGLAAALGLPLISVAPNRLLAGQGIGLPAMLIGVRAGVLVLVAWQIAAVFIAPSRRVELGLLLTAGGLLTGLLWLAGDEASRRSASLPPLARVALGGGFWCLVLCNWLAAADALERLRLSPARQALAHLGLALPLALLGISGQLDTLSLAREYAQRREVFDAAWLRHAQIVLSALAAAVALGLPLGVVAARSEGRRQALLAGLGWVQTLPSVALFGLLMAPLAWAGAQWPDSGIRGVGALPAVIGLTLYALLPIVQGTAAGLRQVPADLLEAGRGLGMTAGQLFWRLEWPLALPLLLAGLRSATVQLIGLTVVAALIGAGGFGTLVFQGLASSAVDLVLLGVLPVVGLAVLTDAGFRLAGAAWAGGQR